MKWPLHSQLPRSKDPVSEKVRMCWLAGMSAEATANHINTVPLLIIKDSFELNDELSAQTTFRLSEEFRRE